MSFLCAVAGCGCAGASEPADSEPTVYFIREITPANLVRIYEALGREATGKVAVKLSTGEPGGHNFLQPALIAPLVQKIDGTIVECNTAYDFTVVLSHFKGHAMGGFGGAIKNISIGIASAAGKAWIHTAGKTRTDLWNNLPAQDDFLESMAEAAKSVADHCGERILYINVMNNLSVDCDCDAHPEAPRMGDIGILASLDPVALDKACVDLVYASEDPGKVHLIERMESRHGIHTLEHAEAIGVGTQQYELVTLE